MANKNLGNLLKIYRRNSLLTQQQVADTLNINRTTYTYYEAGKTEPSIDTLHKLVKIFGITYDDLLPSEKNPRSNKESFLHALENDAIYNLTKEEQSIIIAYRSLSRENKEDFKKKLDKKLKM